MTSCAYTCDPVAQAIGECTRLVKAENLDAWLSVLLAPAAARPALLTIWALVAETARLPWRLNEPLLARLRMEFWREALLEEGDAARDAATQPLLRLWPPALSRQDMGEALAHLALLADGALDTPDQAAQWAENAFTPLLRTLLAAATVSRDGMRIDERAAAAPEQPLRALARGYGLGFLLRRAAFPRSSAPVPLLSGELTEEDAARKLIAMSMRAHAEARRHRWPRRQLAALWPATLMQLWLARAEQVPGFPTKPALMLSQAARQWRLLRHWLLGRL